VARATSETRAISQVKASKAHDQVEPALDQQIVNPPTFSSAISAYISVTSVGFMSVAGSPSSRRRGQSASARDLDPAAIGVGQAIGRLIDPKQKTFAKSRQNALISSRYRSSSDLTAAGRGSCAPRNQPEYVTNLAIPGC
jgi:hypothetical protein